MSEITYGRGPAGLGIILGLFIYDNDLMLKFFETFTNNKTEKTSRLRKRLGWLVDIECY